MKILAIVPALYDSSPGQRFRIEQWEKLLLQHGAEIVYSSFETEELKKVLHSNGKFIKKAKNIILSMFRRISDLRACTNYDLIYVFREAAIFGPAWFERHIAKSGVPMIFDFDDAVFHSYVSPSNGYLSYLKFPNKTAEICKLSAHVMAGNEYLANYAAQFNKNVTIIPTTIDTEKYKVVEKEIKPDIITIGWSGSYSTVQHLDTIRNVLKKLSKETKFRLRVIGTSNYNVDGVNTVATNWKSETELSDLQEIDIGVMPLPNDQWSKGKCGLKALQYMALGIPTICSPVGVNSDIISDGKNGFIADSVDEWVEKLKILIDSAELRFKLGMEGRRTVESGYSAKSQAPRVFDIFNAVAQNNKNLNGKI